MGRVCGATDVVSRRDCKSAISDLRASYRGYDHKTVFNSERGSGACRELVNASGSGYLPDRGAGSSQNSTASSLVWPSLRNLGGDFTLGIVALALRNPRWIVAPA